MEYTLSIAVIILVGFFFGEAAEKFMLPKVSGYILAGIFFKLFTFPTVPPDFHHRADFFIDIALAFITFSVGGSLLFSKMKRLGKAVLGIAFFEVGFSVILVVGAFLLLSHLFAPYLPASWIELALPLSLLFGSFAAPTDPATILAVTHEYQASGEVSSSIMGVAAVDDALGIVIFSIGVAVARVFVSQSGLEMGAVLLSPLIEIIGGVFIGGTFGWLFNKTTLSLPRLGKGAMVVLVLGSISLCFSLAHMLSCDELLSTMAMGGVVGNFNPRRQSIFQVLEEYIEELVFVLFFVFSGMYFKISALSSAYPFIIVFVLFRSLGKLSGASVGGYLAGAPDSVRRYTGLGLMPQGGIVIGLALLVQEDPAFSSVSSWFISTVIGATIIHELLGPIFVKTGLHKAGEKFMARQRQSGEAKAAVASARDSAEEERFLFSELLHTYTVRDLKDKILEVSKVPEGMSFFHFKKTFMSTAQEYFPVVNAQGEFIGIFSLGDVRSLLLSSEVDEVLVVQDIAKTPVIYTTPADSLYTVISKCARKNLGAIPVVEEGDPGKLLGFLRYKEVILFYEKEAKKYAGNRVDKESASVSA